MKIKQLIVFVLGFTFGTFGQTDSTEIKRNELINQMRKFAKEESDSTYHLRKLLKESYSLIDKKNDSIEQLYKDLMAADRYFLISKYANPLLVKKFNKEQYNDFQRNKFLKNELTAEKGISVFYALNETTVDYAMYKSIDNLVNEFQSNVTKKIILQSFSDKLGDEKVNESLSKQRAESFKNYLIKKCNLSPSSIEIQNYGEGGSKRINDSELDFLNRRVLLIVE